jgi:type II secretory pathway component PulK
MIAFPIHRRNSRRALALIVVVYVLAALGTLTFALAFRSGLHLCQAQLVMDQVQQGEIVRAANAQACRLLAMDDPNLDSFADAWAGWHALEAPSRPGAADSAPWQAWWRLEDESARINVNLAPSDVLARIEGLDGAAVASILDWIDQDDVPGPDGAEKAYYAGLSPAYACRNGPLETLEELVFVKGITAELYFGTGKQEQSDDLSDSVTGQALAGDMGEDPVGLSELLTIYGDGRINLNTVLPTALKAIPFLSDAARNEILSRQQREGRKFTTLEDIRSNGAFTLADKTVLLQVARFNSSHFQLRVRIRLEGMSSMSEYGAILERGGRAVRVLNWQRKPPRLQGDDLHGPANPG